MIYREIGRSKCPACRRSIAVVHESTTKNNLIARHLYQEDTEVNGIGLPHLTSDGFCPGSFNAPEEDNEVRSKNGNA